MKVVKTVSIIMEPREAQAILDALFSHVTDRLVIEKGLPNYGVHMRLRVKIRAATVPVANAVLVETNEIRAILDSLRAKREDRPGGLDAAEVDGMCGILERNK